MVSAVSGLPEPSGAPISTELLAQLATALFAERPGAPGLPPGVQAPVNIAPPGSPLASPAGLGPSVPGTPISAGVLPGSNLLPASPTPVLSLAHRAPALLPHAAAGNGVPDSVLATLPAYEPRLGGLVQGVPHAAAPQASASQAVAAPVSASTPGAGYYFLEPPSAAAAPADSSGASLQALADQARRTAPDSHLNGIDLRGPRGADVAPLGHQAHPAPVPGAAPQYYFVHAVPLPSGFVTPAKPHPHADAAPVAAQQDRHPGFDIQAVRRDFPILAERINGKPLVWLDNAATTHKPRQVIERISHFYAHENSNIHRAAHTLAARATDAYEHAREVVRRFINAPEAREVVFVRGTTEAINLVAKAWGGANVGEGDEIIISHLEHHANIVPWQQLAAAKGARLRVIPVDDQGQIRLDEYQKLINDRTKIVAIGHVSNVLGTVVPVKQVVEIAKRRGITTLIDGAQSIAHTPVDVQELGADFFVFSGHKIFAPTGIGVLWGRREVLEAMPPWQGGGNMIADVTFEKTVYQPLPNTFEAGTGNIADAVGLGAALEYVERIGIAQISRYEHALVDYGMAQLARVPGLRLIGTVPGKASVLAFTQEGYSTDEVGQALNAEGIAVRTGHHCAQPILRRFGVETAVRPSLAFYNTFDEVDQLVREVRKLAAQRR
ncbi:family 2A encapsulin nanocompartment cargo protein cysteine desulfurase [Comamonas sp. 23]|uniref:family 2A encapsulin nanocompartment cargo protein cysteine desulfurase n=1 Tax=Comamonas sp. 23 TaxID=3415008 RepID=UPI003C6EC51F